MGKHRAASWRRILKRHGPGFLSWLNSHEHRYRCFDRLASYLEGYLKTVLTDEDGCRIFWDVIPDVRAGCNESSIFENPLAAEAYAYVHLLERYRRFWDVLLHLTQKAILPLGDRGVNVLDIGTGPAPALYAVDDYYRLLIEFAQERGIEELQLPPPRLDCVERSWAMMNFCHLFCEYSQRSGPFGATFSDFSGVDFPRMREQQRYALATRTYYEPETGEYWYDFSEEEAHDIGAAAHRYRLVILSYFLTLSEMVDTFQHEISSLFQDLNPGSIAVVVGAHGSRYQNIYTKLEGIAQETGIRHVHWADGTLGEESWPQFASRMKQFHNAVYQHLDTLCDPDTLKRSGYPDYWSARPSAKFRPRFGLRVFRKGKW